MTPKKRGSKKTEPHERIKQLEVLLVKYEAEEELLTEEEQMITAKNKRLKSVRERIARIYADIGQQRWIIAQRAVKQPQRSPASSE